MDKKAEAIEEMKKAIKEVADEKERVKLVALNNLMNKKKELDEVMNKEIREVERKFQELSVSVLNRQQEIVEGKALATEELVKLGDYLTEEEQKGEHQDTTAIHHYWFKALKNQEVVGAEITEKDEPALQALHKVTFTTAFDEEKEEETVKVTFYFQENEYFSNSELTKTVVINSEEQRPVESLGTEIEWKEGKDLTKKTVQKKQKNKKTNQSRMVTKTVDDESFFNLFSDSKREDLEDEDDEEADKLQERLEIDFDIISSLAEEVIPYSLEYYLDLNQADFEDDEDQLDQVDEEGGDSSDGANQPKKKKNKKKSRKASKEGDQQQQECKQQ